jgi:dipeptidyl aminopeptidase/acylaminoacyl peptidase
VSRSIPASIAARSPSRKASKKDVELVTLKKEDHWLSRGETRLQMLEATGAFLRANNPRD